MSAKPRCLDLFCGAGGCSAGYTRAGFDVTGVDIVPMPRYPSRFVLGDALEYLAAHGHEYDFIHASPPCQRFIRLAKQQRTSERHPDLIGATRAALKASGKPYIIENVPDAPLENPLVLCGTMFGLKVIRHRAFETSPIIWWSPAPCDHPKEGPGRRGNEGKREFVSVYGHFSGVARARAAMELPWMTRDDLAQAIPPAFTEWLGRQILEAAGEEFTVPPAKARELAQLLLEAATAAEGDEVLMRVLERRARAEAREAIAHDQFDPDEPTN